MVPRSRSEWSDSVHHLSQSYTGPLLKVMMRMIHLQSEDCYRVGAISMAYGFRLELRTEGFGVEGSRASRFGGLACKPKPKRQPANG